MTRLAGAEEGRAAAQPVTETGVCSPRMKKRYLGHLGLMKFSFEKEELISENLC